MEKPYNRNFALPKEWAELSALIKNHYYLKRDGAELNVGIADEVGAIIFTKVQIDPIVIYKEEISLFTNIITNARGPSVITALTQKLPTAKHFVEAGGKSHRTDKLNVHTYSGETKDIWTIGGKFRGKASLDNPRQITWYHLKPET